MKKQIILALTLCFAAPAFAEGGGSLGYSFSQGATVNGGKQEFSSSINLSDFDTHQIAFRIYQVMHLQMMLNGYGTGWKSPHDVPPDLARLLATYAIPRPLPAGSKPVNDPDVIDLYQRALHIYGFTPTVQQITAGADNSMDAIYWGILPVTWAVDAYRAGMLNKQVYLYNLEMCERQSAAVSLGGGLEGVVYAKEPLSCLVSSYLTAYGVARTSNGFLQGNLRGLVPLCVLSQGNTCGIDHGWLQRRDAYIKQAIEDAQAQRQADLQEKAHTLTQMHLDAVAAYTHFTGRPIPAGMFATSQPAPSAPLAPALTLSQVQTSALDVEMACVRKFKNEPNYAADPAYQACLTAGVQP
jgi:hypothetical protein